MTIKHLDKVVENIQFPQTAKTVFDAFSKETNCLTELKKKKTLNKILDILQRLDSWQIDSTEKIPVDKVEFAKNILCQKRCFINWTTEVEPKLSQALNTLNCEENEEWKPPLQLINEIMNLSKNILLKHLNESEIIEDASIKCPAIENEDIFNSNIQTIYDSQYKELGLTANESLKLSKEYETSYIWKAITLPSYLWWKEDRNETINKIQSFQMATLSTLKTLETKVDKKDPLGEDAPPIDSFAVRVLKNKIFQLDEENEPIQKLQKEIQATAMNILKKVLPDQLNTGANIKKNELWFNESIRVVELW